METSGNSGGAITGQTIPCPHCGMDTILFIPRVGVPKPVEHYAEQLKKLSDESKLKNESRVENELDSAGIIFLIIGVGGLLAGAYFAFQNGQGFEPLFLICGFAAALNGAISYLLFKGFAEVIRLLRKK
jgi:hypothetical protein